MTIQIAVGPQTQVRRTPARRPESSTMVIFGASGDLAHRKLLPALYDLYAEELLPSGFAVVGYARSQISHEDYRAQMRDAVRAHSRTPLDPDAWDDFAQNLYYCPGAFENDKQFERLKALVAELDERNATQCRHLYYLATPPAAYPTIVQQLGRTDMAQAGDGGWTRIIVEKPFGRDLPSAQALNRELLQVFDESQIYRIDHYLGKETTQNILAFRFGNSMFEPVWNRRYVDHVEITVAETLGMEGRGAYYDTAGALRDIVENHMMQLLALTAMEPPAMVSADAVRDEKVKVLHAVHALQPDEVGQDTVRAQYRAGVAGGEELPDYRAEPGVARDSSTETYVAVKLCVDNWRWAGVPFYLRTGKALAKRTTEVVIQFRQPPLLLFRHDGRNAEQQAPEANVLRLRIQPDEGISLCFGVKVPGAAMRLQPVDMSFSYKDAFGTAPPEAYERLLHDAMLGDNTLFIRGDEVEAAWRIMDSILAGWARGKPPVTRYAAGTWGPREADEFMRRDGREWTEL